MSDARKRRPAPARKPAGVAPFSWRESLLQILALWTFGVAQPIYSTLAAQVEYFIAHDSQPVDLAIFVLTLSLALPSLLFLLELPFRRWSRAHTAVHLSLCAPLLMLSGVQIAKLLAGLAKKVAVFPDLGQLAFGLALGAAATVALARSAGFRRMVDLGIVLVLTCPVVFLNSGTISQIAFGTANADPMLDPVKADTPIIYIMLDELPLVSLLDSQATIDASRFPNIAALAADSTWYRYASSTCDDTRTSVPSMLTAMQPTPEKPPLLRDYPRNLFTWLGSTYQLKVKEYVTKLSPRGISQTLKDPLDVRLGLLAEDTAIYFVHMALPASVAARLAPPVGDSWDRFARPKNTREPRAQGFRDYINAIEASEKPTLYFAHILLPHFPYVYLPTEQEYDNSGNLVCDGMVDEYWQSDWEAYLGLQRHLLQLACVDSLVGELVARLKSTGLYDRSLIVLTSDHGASFRGRLPHRTANQEILGQAMFVPLIIKEPFQKQGRVSSANASAVDILPTIADILGLSIPWVCDGSSLRQRADKPEGGKRFLASLHTEKGQVYQVENWLDLYEQARKQVPRQFPQSGVSGLFRIGPRQDLYGKSVDSLSLGKAAPYNIETAPFNLLQDVDPKAKFLPARLTGTLLGYQAKELAPLAIALHGKIAALTNVMPNGYFESMLDPALLREGDNFLQIYLIEGETLRPVPLKKDTRYRLEANQLVSDSGEAYPLRENPDSVLDKWIIEEQSRVRLEGWVSAAAPVTAEKLIVFRGEEYICAWPLQGSGKVKFEHDVPFALVGEQLPRLAALLSDGTAVELARRDNYTLKEVLHVDP